MELPVTIDQELDELSEIFYKKYIGPDVEYNSEWHDLYHKLSSTIGLYAMCKTSDNSLPVVQESMQLVESNIVELRQKLA